MTSLSISASDIALYRHVQFVNREPCRMIQRYCLRLFWRSCVSKFLKTQTMGKATKLSKTKNTVKPVYNSHLGKWQGDRYIQGDHYILVNCAENVRQLKILGSYPVTIIYRLTAIYRFDCNRNITKQIQKEKLMVKLKVD